MHLNICNPSTDYFSKIMDLDSWPNLSRIIIYRFIRISIKNNFAFERGKFNLFLEKWANLPIPYRLYSRQHPNSA